MNQFINVAVAEKLAHLEYQKLAARALKLLDKASKTPVEPGDELPPNIVVLSPSPFPFQMTSA